MPDIVIPVEALDPVQRIPCDEASPAAGGPVRIEEVARRAGVSSITVSRSFRKPELVSDTTRARVEEAVRATGFSLNPHASALRSGRTNIITAFISTVASPQFLRAADAFALVLEGAGYEVVLARTSYSYEREIRLARTLEQMRPAGAFITGVLEQELCRSIFRRLAIPVVESWANSSSPIDMLVAVSNTDGARTAARFMAERGYRRLSFIGRASGRGIIRHTAFREECRALGVEFVEGEILASVRSADDGRAALSRLLGRGERIDAIFCANDLLACGALIEARARGLDVPGDLALMGFGDSDLMQAIAPGLTTVTPDPEAIGRLAGEMLAARLGGRPPPETTILLPLHLRVRGSV